MLVGKVKHYSQIILRMQILHSIFDWMKQWSGLIFSFSLFMAFVPVQSQTSALPFTLQLEDITYEDWPGLHSFSFGKWDGRWIIVGGRIDGLHAFLPPNPFPVSSANHFIRMLDPQTGEQWNKSIYVLPLDIANQLRSANMQFVQKENYLYVMGGYGADSLSGNKITFPSLIAIDLDMLDDILMNDEDPTPAFRKLDDSLFMVTGGEAEILNDTVYLFGGHEFTGEYEKNISVSFTQTYTEELRKFVLHDDGESITISNVQKIKDTTLFHRRDLNFEPVLFPDMQYGLAAYSGVFQKDADLPFLDDIIFKEDGSYYLQEDFEHRMNNYTCPVLNCYDSLNGNFYSTFFGGMSQYYYDEEELSIEDDLNIPFVNDITTIVRYGDDSVKQIINTINFDELLGSNAIIDIHAEIAQYEHHVLNLNALNGTFDAGYIYGGIKAFIPNFTSSNASNRLFKLKITHSTSSVLDTEIRSSILVYPNPAHSLLYIENNSSNIFSRLILKNTLGQLLLDRQISLPAQNNLQINVETFSAGVYYLILSNEKQTVAKKIIINSVVD